MNNDIKVKYHNTNGNVSWEEVMLTAISGLTLVGVLFYATNYI